MRWGSNGEKKKIAVKRIIVLVALSLVLALTFTGLFISASYASGLSTPLLLYGDVSYKDGSPAPNVEVSVKNEASGESLSAFTNEKGVWSIEVSAIADCGDEVLVIAKDAWNNEVSEKVNVTGAPQGIDLKFDVSPPTTTPPSDGGSSGGGETSSGTQSKTEQGTERVTPAPTPTSTPPSLPTEISNANVSENGANISQSNHNNRSKSPMAVVSAVIALVAGLAFVTLLIYRRKNKKV